MVVLDTSIIIDHLRTKGKQESVLRSFFTASPKEVPAISVATLQELYAGKSTANAEKEREMLQLLGALKILPYSRVTARLAGTLMRDHSLTFADAAIAATAILHEAPLLTLNKKHFQVVSELAVLP